MSPDLKRRSFMAAGAAAAGATLLPNAFAVAKASAGKKGVMLMNRIGPSASTLYIADADGSNERRLLPTGAFEYHAAFSADGASVFFTSERTGDGNSGLYRAKSDGSGVTALVVDSAMNDWAVPSPDGTKVAYVSTSGDHKAHIWVLDLATGKRTNLTGTKALAGDPASPDCQFRPSWSPDSQWIAFSSDRNTTWRGHSDGKGWEHTQELSVYVIRPDGTGFRQVATKEGYCLGSPKWSPDGSRIVFYEITVEGTWGAHRPEAIGTVESQIVSVDVATGGRTEHTSGAGLKVAPQYLSATEIGYLVKGGANEGLAYTGGARPAVKRALRSPVWSADGKSVIYEKPDYTTRALDKPLYSWDSDWDYRFCDVFPVVSRSGRLAITSKQSGNSSIVTMRADGSDQKVVFDSATSDLDQGQLEHGLAGAFRPAWSPDGKWIAFGLGGWFQTRATAKAVVVRVPVDGSSAAQVLTDGSVNAGFPSYSADGTKLVYRLWGAQMGLRILDLKTGATTVLTTESDNLPDWSPDGKLILFTRKTSATNFDVCTIKPDGTGLKILTTTGANDGHAVWNPDGRILYNSGMYGFREEAALYDDTFQPYGQIFSMKADGSGIKMLTDSQWEDSMPIYLTNAQLAAR
ncbi:TolB family protein [Streptomyces sp. NPDC048590]|uniref:TolB family protein n=1 Tax=Streptomyces sp. NPDC048590 TaxID=3365574 RepID=UPI0037203DC5